MKEKTRWYSYGRQHNLFHIISNQDHFWFGLIRLNINLILVFGSYEYRDQIH